MVAMHGNYAFFEFFHKKKAFIFLFRSLLLAIDLIVFLSGQGERNNRPVVYMINFYQKHYEHKK